MTKRLYPRLTALLIGSQLAAGCSRFVWHEDPFTPDQAPVSETVAVGRDTTYVLKGPSYYLLSNDRSALWNRDVMEDVAWRYHALFGNAPPVIAVRLDTSRAPAAAIDSATTWRGVPFAAVAVRRRPSAAPGKKQVNREPELEENDSVRVRMLTGPVLAATAAETWLRARNVEATRVSDSQPGGPTRTVITHASLPAWIEAGALRILGSGGAPDRANAELRADTKHIVPLASLFSVAWSAPPNAVEIVRPGLSRFGLDDEADRPGMAGRVYERRD